MTLGSLLTYLARFIPIVALALVFNFTNAVGFTYASVFFLTSALLDAQTFHFQRQGCKTKMGQ